MTRHTLLSFGLVALVVLSGCSVVEAQRYPTPRRGGTVYRPADYRADRYDVRRSDEWRRVQRDVREYVRYLDRELGLGERQEYRIADILERRTYQLLERDRGYYSRDVYPFPRRFGQNRFRNRDVAYFWRDADRRVERILDRRQTQQHRRLVEGRHRGSRYGDRDWYRYDDDYRYRDGRRYRERGDRRYDDRRERDDDDDDRRRRRGRDRD